MDYDFSSVNFDNSTEHTKLVEAVLHNTEKDLRLSMCMSGYGVMTFKLRKKVNIDKEETTNWNGIQNTRHFGVRIKYCPDQKESYGIGQDDDGSEFTMILQINRKEQRMFWRGST